MLMANIDYARVSDWAMQRGAGKEKQGYGYSSIRQVFPNS